MGNIAVSATFTNTGSISLAIGGTMHQPVPASEMADIQTAVASLFDKQCVIQRATATSDGYLGQTKTWAVINNVQAGMTQPTAGQLANYDYLIGALATWQIRLPYGTDVKAQDHLIIDGQTLVVQVLLNPRSFASTTLLLASEVK